MPAKKGSKKADSKSKATKKDSSKKAAEEKEVKIWRVGGKINRDKRLAKVGNEVSEANILPSTRTRARKDYNYADTLKVESLQKKKGVEDHVYTVPARKTARKSKNLVEARAKSAGVKKQKKTGSKTSKKKGSEAGDSAKKE